MNWTTPRTWAASEVVTAAVMNTHVRDNLKAMTEWTTYTPTWTGTGGTPTVGNGTLTGRYIVAGNLLTVRIDLLWGSTTSSTGVTVWRFALPSGRTASGMNVLAAQAYDSSAITNFAVNGFASPGATTVGVATHGGGNAGVSLPFTWANADRLTIEGVVEV